MRKNKVIISIISGAIVLFAVAILFHSCSGGGSGGGIPSGTVALYVTDDMSDHQQVIATINKVTVLNTGSGASCDVLTIPTTIDIANLKDVLQLLNTADCPAVPYNRIHIEFNKTVDIMDPSGEPSSCSFVSYKDDHNRPNTLTCNGNVCTLDINGAVNVLMNHPNKVALDFRLKDFDVHSFGTTTCSVTMKVSPIHGEDFHHLGHKETFTGLVTNLTTSTSTFDLSKHHISFHVLYSGITSTQQPGLNDLLLRAENDGLKTQVTVSAFDFENKTVDAAKILVKAEGIISALTTSTKTFILSYNTGSTINVDYSKAVIKGTLADNAEAEVKLYGFDSPDFLAALVRVEFEAEWPDHETRERECED
jgi:hypothetical protein